MKIIGTYTVDSPCRARLLLLPFLVVLLFYSPEVVSATPNIQAVDLHPILRWVCSWRDAELFALADDYFPVNPNARSGKNYNVCTGFRGGDAAQNETDPASGSTVVAEKRDPLDFTKSPYAFSLYQDGDGSQEDPDGIPSRYLKMQGDRRDHAKKALELTLRWRKEHDIDTILARPHEKFDLCKRVFPHYFCGRDDSNHVILLQRPGLIDLNIAHANGMSGEDLLYHYIYEMEYLWQVLEPSANGTMTSIIDLTGLNLSVLGKRELMGVVQKFCSTMDAHFPTRSHKTLLINAPKWFGALYKIISPFYARAPRRKFRFCQRAVLKTKP